MADLLWKPGPDQTTCQMHAFERFARLSESANIQADEPLQDWSVRDIESFWSTFLAFSDIVFEGSPEPVMGSRSMPGADWFPNVQLSYPEQVFRHYRDRVAVVYQCENTAPMRITYGELQDDVARCASALRGAGVTKGDRVAGYVANVPEAIVAFLATASIGAVWTSASPDFQLDALEDRFGQIEPVLLFASASYQYKGRRFETDAVIAGIRKRIPSIQSVVILPAGEAQPEVVPGTAWSDFLGEDAVPAMTFERVPFQHPLYILYSSGTTGVPKCIVHGTGGALIQHQKELLLHTDLGPEDRMLYFTTTGWMMWNWLVSGLTVGATIVLYDGNPAFPDITSIWRAVNELNVTHFGTSGRHIESCMKLLDADGRERMGDLESLRSILYTGSPLSESGYRWIYNTIKPDVHLAGIAGGTDIVSCFMLGNPTLPVYAGQIQGPGLGVDIVALDESGEPVIDEPGELVCRQPLPSMPVSFWNDDDGSKYRSAYFEIWPNWWRHGDYVTFTPEGGIVIHGRSDATLNPGGVRIGSAEIYAALDDMSFVTGGVAVGWSPSDRSDEAIVLFVSLIEGRRLDEATAKEIRQGIRSHCSPRHVPEFIRQISAIPTTRSGKTVELSVKAILSGKAVKNRSAMANPEVLDEIEAIRSDLQSA